MNLALLHQYQIRYMVTKESGASGGFSEKISAAKKAGVSVFVIENPEAENGEQKENLEEILQEIERLTGKHIRRKQMQVSLVGIGMGNTKLITEEAAERIKGADLLFGAKRLLDAVPAQWNVAAERLPYYLAKDILPCLMMQVKKVGKPFSMQSFYFPAIPDSTAAQKKWCRHCRAGRTRRCPSVLGFPRFLIWLRAVVTAGRMLKSSACMGQTRWIV